MVCWASWETLASFALWKKDGITFKAEPEDERPELPEGAISDRITCEWCNPNVEEPATHFIFGSRVDEAFFVCEDCLLVCYAGAVQYETRRLKDLNLYAAHTFDRECEGCKKVPGLVFYRPKEYKLRDDGAPGWYCLECLRLGILADEDEFKDIRVEAGGVVSSQDKGGGGSAVPFNPMRSYNENAAIAGELIELPEGAGTMRRVLTKDDEAREKIRQHLIGGDGAPLGPRMSARREGLVLAAPEDMDTRVGQNVLNFFQHVVRKETMH